MSSKSPIIRVSGLSKLYRIGRLRGRHTTLASWVAETVRHPFRREPRPETWALRDIDLEVEEGEILGLIGGNGAGKSTLLKILSRITEPTGGQAILRGRVASLLEVGTGFHVELTGRENIYLNGALIGMRRREITSTIDAIVDFSGIGAFLDTPMKRYSSGMFVRLAFAVAAHLRADILLVDEVLAVGDYAFQQKCLGAMHTMAGGGRTVLFVSHSLPAVRQLCSKAAVLDRGRLVALTCVDEALEEYIRLQGSPLEGGWRAQRTDSESPASFLSLDILDSEGLQRSEFRLRETWCARVVFSVQKPTLGLICGIGLSSASFGGIATRWTRPLDLEPGEYRTELTWTGPPLATGQYHFALGLSMASRSIEYVENAGSLKILDFATGAQPVSSRAGVFLLDGDLSVERLASP